MLLLSVMFVGLCSSVTNAEIILNWVVDTLQEVNHLFSRSRVDATQHQAKSSLEGHMIEIIFTLWLIAFQERIL